MVPVGMGCAYSCQHTGRSDGNEIGFSVARPRGSGTFPHAIALKVWGRASRGNLLPVGVATAFNLIPPLTGERSRFAEL